MIVNANNAALVATILTAMSDERFTMRTIKGIKKGTSFTDLQIAEAVMAMRMPVAHRNVDSAPLVVRPIDRAKLLELRDAVNALTGDATMIIDFQPHMALEDDSVIDGEAVEVLPQPRRLLN